MSSTVHHPQDLDAALLYGRPCARKAGKSLAAKAGEPASASPRRRCISDAEEPCFIGDRAMLQLQRRLARDPDLVPAPPLPIDAGPSLHHVAWRLCAVASIAALAAWAMTPAAPKPAADTVVQAAAAPPLTATPVRLVHVSAAIELPRAPAAMQATPMVAAAFVPEQARPQMMQPEPALQQQAGQPSETGKSAALAPDEIALLIKRGKEQAANGDISAARLLLQRAADAGSAEAALALGSTFDPLVVKRLGAIGVQTDAAKAREWYQKAAALGSNLAPRQLANLAEAGR